MDVNAGARLTPVPPPAPTKVATTRTTVDLPRPDHRALRRVCDELAEELGRSRVTSQDVMVALVRRIAADADLRRSVGADLSESADQ